ncbi:FAD-dependent oxidoreductase [soil metagenome]
MRIAIVGAGVTGLGAAYVLSGAHEVEVFEEAGRAGGHVNTVHHEGLALDTGFIVHNEPNYPAFGRLLRELGVATRRSEMSFSVSCGDCGLEWSGRRPFAQGRRLTDRRFLSLLSEVVRWLRTAEGALEDGTLEGRTLGGYAKERGYSQRFRTHFLMPLASALWSSAPEQALDFPAAYGIRFFERHGMLGLRRHRWQTIEGGAHTYVAALLERLRGRVHLGLGVRAVRRDESGVELVAEDGETRRYDKIVLATHADQSLGLLADPSDDERRLLGAWRYTTNEAVLHTDERFLPRARSARASWNYQLNGSSKPTVTYYLNRLQRLDSETHYCLTLNRSEEIDPESALMRTVYTHPLYTPESMAAQAELPALSGRRHTEYAGAYHGYGFHEDGFASGVRAAAALGVEW